MSVYPPSPTGRVHALDLAYEHPMPRELRDQIAAWIEPHTMNVEIKHRDAMTCVEIAYPLIRAYIAQHPDGDRD